MATITSTIKLVDRMTPTLNKISKAVDRVNQASSKIGKANNWRNMNSAVQRTTKSTHNLYYALRRIAFTLGSLRGAQAFIETADSMMNATARIENINDGLYTTSEYLDQIYEAAQRSRGNFTEMASSVGKLGMLTGKTFGNVSEMIQFSELMNKLFVISGASAAESSNATYQLTQAMAAGKLQGDEMRSIMENAPLLAHKIADALGVTTAEVKELGAEGVITADVIKRSLFGAAAEIESKFEKMPKTIGQTWTEIKNYCVNAFRPVIDRIQKFINGPTFKKIKNVIFGIIDDIADAVVRLFDQFEKPEVKNAIDTITNALRTLWNVAKRVGDFVVNLAVRICEQWEHVAPIVYTAVAAFLLFKIVTTVMNAFNAVLAITEFIISLFSSQLGLVVLAILGVILAIFLLVDVFNTLTDSAVSACGVIAGVIAFLLSATYDVFNALFTVLAWGAAGIALIVGVCWNLTIAIIKFVGNCLAAIGRLLKEIGKPIDDWINRLWDNFVILIQNIGAFIGNLFSALARAIFVIFDNIGGVFRWILAAVRAVMENIAIGIQRSCLNINLFFDIVGLKIELVFWKILAGALAALTDLIKSNRDACVEMVKPFVDLGNAVRGIFQKIKSWWNSLIDTLSGGINVSSDIEGFKNGTVNVSGSRFDDLGGSKLTSDDLIGPAGSLSTIVSTKIAALNAVIAGTESVRKPVNWSINEIPSLGDYADVDAIKNAWNEGWNRFDYQDFKDMSFDGWDIDGMLASVKEAFKTFDPGSNLDNIKTVWGEYLDACKWLFDSNRFLNPFEQFMKWYEKGENFENDVTGIVDAIGSIIEELKTQNKIDELIKKQREHEPTIEELLVDGGMPKDNAGLEGNNKSPFNSDPIGDLLGSIADNTGKAAGGVANIEDTLDLAEEELELLRKIAEQEVINRFTTAEIKVDMTNNNNISSKMDLDGIVTHLSNKLYEELGVVASGVHY